MNLVDNCLLIYLKEAIDPFFFFFFFVCAWLGNAENGTGGKEIEFFLLNGLKLVKVHSDGKLIHLAINIY